MLPKGLVILSITIGFYRREGDETMTLAVLEDGGFYSNIETEV
jgi:hypothetical protein